MNREHKRIIFLIERLQTQLQALKHRVASEMEIEKEGQGARPLCWACGGRMRRTVYKYNCMQDNGPCGYICVLNERDVVGGHKKISFRPTQSHHDGTPAPQGPYPRSFIHLMIVAGEPVGHSELAE